MVFVIRVGFLFRFCCFSGVVERSVYIEFLDKVLLNKGIFEVSEVGGGRGRI